MKKLLTKIVVAAATLMNIQAKAQDITFPVTFSNVNITFDGRTGVGQVLPDDIRERTGVLAVISNTKQTYVFFENPKRGQEVYNRLPSGEPEGDSYEVKIGSNEYNAYRYYTSRARGNYFYMKRPNQPYFDTDIRNSYKGKTIIVSIKQNVSAVLLHEIGGYRFDLSGLDENNHYEFTYEDAPYTRFGISQLKVNEDNQVIFDFNTIEDKQRFIALIQVASVNGMLLGSPTTPENDDDAIIYNIPIPELPTESLSIIFTTTKTL